MNLYVGNLAYSMRDDDLHALFSAHGSVDSARVIMDRVSGRSKGFGFVEMSDDEAARAAIEALNGTEIEGRNVVVNEARPREDKRPRGGFNRDRGDRGGYGRDR
ncbi:MAG: RNA-binding protein [Victivallales bacterium]|nr:RNA-binding protein [Victivallales bacterium]